MRVRSWIATFRHTEQRRGEWTNMKPLAFRAGWTKLAIQGVNRLPEDERARVRELVGAQMLARIREAATVSWLPGEAHLAVVRAVEQGLGTPKAHAFWRERMMRIFESSLVKGFLGSTLRLFDVTPYSVLRTSPPVYRFVTQNAGIHEVFNPEPQLTIVSFREAPSPLCHSSFYALCHGQCLAVLDFAKVTGEVTDKIVKPGEFQFHLRHVARTSR
jgi:hypothetical protein